MKSKLVKVIIILLIVILVTGCGEKRMGSSLEVEHNDEKVDSISNESNQLINRDSIQAAFVLANTEGSQVITFLECKDLEDLSRMTHVISGDGYYEVEYISNQKETSDYNYRETMYEFENMPGHIFSIKGGTVLPNETCLLVNESIISRDSLVEISDRGIEQLADETTKIIEIEKCRNVENAWSLATGVGWEIGLVQYEKINNDMLASIVLVNDAEVKMIDYPAVYDEVSTWRLEDYGQLDPMMFRVNFVAKDSQGFVISMSWNSYESEQVFILTETIDKLKSIEVESGRYILPL